MDGLSKRALFAALFLALLVQATPARAHPLDVVPADHWVYEEMYRLAARGLVPLWAASTRPLTRLEVARMIGWSLGRLQANRDLFTGSDLSDLEALVLEFADELAFIGYRVVNPPLGPSALSLTGWGVNLERAVVGRIEAGQPPWYGRRQASGLFLRIRGSLGFGPSLMAGAETLHGLTFDLPQEEAIRRLYLSGEFLGSTIQVGRDTLWWGPGRRGAFLLSDNAGPLEFLRLSIAGERWRFTKVVAPLDYQGRFLYGMRLDWLRSEGLRVGLGETVVGRGGIYFPYVLNPIPMLTGGLASWARRGLGFSDNYNLSLDFDWRARRGVVVYGEVYLDDVAMPGNPFPSRVGATGGLYLSDPFRDGKTTLRLEHTRATNWLYTADDRSGDYVRGGRSLGHWCAPDCELWSVVAAHRLSEGSTVELAYELVRKGEGELGQRWGSIEEAWSKLYLSGVVESTQGLRLTYTWRQPPDCTSP
jgi:hypothetical protein